MLFRFLFFVIMALQAAPTETNVQEESLIGQLAIEGVVATSEDVADTLAPDMPWCNSHNCGHACSACGATKQGLSVWNAFKI